MLSVRYTRIEITPDAYRSLEAEAILQGKTLKKLASELILNGVSKKALDFVQESARPSTLNMPDMEFDEDTAKAMKKIGDTGIHISDLTLEAVKKVILEEGVRRRNAACRTAYSLDGKGRASSCAGYMQAIQADTYRSCISY